MAAGRLQGSILMDFLRELWAVLNSRKKLWRLPIILVLLLLGGLIVFVQGSAIAPFIYTVFYRAHSRHLGRLSRQRRCLDRRRRECRRRAGGAFPSRKTLCRLPCRGRALLSRRGRAVIVAARSHCLLRKAAAQIRAAARNLTRDRAGGISLLCYRHADMAQGKALSEEAACRCAARVRSAR